MIDKGYFVHNATEAPLSTFQFTHPTFHAFLVAALTTILSYQTTAIITDVCLGFKSRASRGTARVTDLSIMHFSEQASILAVAAAVLNTRFLTSWRYHGLRGDRGSCKHQLSGHPRKRRGRLSPRVVSKLFLLLLAAPLVNLVATVLSLETDNSLSFAEAGFGGVALGIFHPGEPPVHQIQRYSDCREFETSFRAGELPAAQFILCVSRIGLSVPIEDSNIDIILTANTNGIVTVEISSALLSYTMTASGLVRIGDKVYRLRQIVTNDVEGATEVVQNASRRLATNLCSNSQNILSGLQISPTVQLTEDRTQLKVSATVPCRYLSGFAGDQELVTMSQSTTIKEADFFEVVELTGGPAEEEFSPGDDLPLVLRRKPYISFFTLIVAVCVVVVVRVVTGFLTSNDTNMGCELIVKDAIGMRSFDSMLRGCKIVKYSDTNFKGWRYGEL